ncbi:Galactokinase [Pseudobythopirellula maris]|uniref:Galactokinase n=1 Tax=Pseudobythopirellula maris TaxID=2527991 RepID=A0A5C5ZR91_9BACT|nr:galactokinase [Pseudobythopirellula maris]TWT90014.1 Galactokinase [Pseudobythopirellula maris]
MTPALSELVDRARSLFAERFGSQARWVAAAPGRVNLIGEHTDYNDGFVLPMAIDRHVVIAAAPREAGGDAGCGPGMRLWSEMTGETATIDPQGPLPSGLARWAHYPYGVLELLRQRGVAMGATDAVLLSTVPLGSGLSSSAALEVATATLAEAAAGAELGVADKARLCQQAENEFAGVPCGVMDQFASAGCKEGSLLRLDCRSFETTDVAMADPNVAVLIVNSGVSHNLGDSEYPKRRSACEAAATALGVDALRDATADMIESSDKLDDLARRRARHVVTENQRVLDFCDAIESGRWREAGELMVASHESLRDDYEVSCPEVDTLVECLLAIGADGGVHGARITGGGFGGCVVSLIDRAKADSIIASATQAYQKRTGIDAAAFVTPPCAGAAVVSG